MDSSRITTKIKMQNLKGEKKLGHTPKDMMGEGREFWQKRDTEDGREGVRKNGMR